MGSFAPVFKPNPSIMLNTDAPLAGQGASKAESKTGGLFSFEETKQRITISELKVALFELKSLV